MCLEQSIADEQRQLIARYVSGDRDAIGTVENWIDATLSSCFSRLAFERDDLRQLVHQKLLLNLQAGRYRGESSFRTYVSRITRYTGIDYLRTRREHLPFESAPAPEQHAAPTPPGFDAMLGAASPRCRELWRLVFWEGLSYDEVARRLGVPVGTVKSRAWHCRQRALEHLARHREEQR
jgi:RNA polymerase sigma-70 factor (ECF subfamily)